MWKYGCCDGSTPSLRVWSPRMRTGHTPSRFPVVTIFGVGMTEELKKRLTNGRSPLLIPRRNGNSLASSLCLLFLMLIRNGSLIFCLSFSAGDVGLRGKVVLCLRKGIDQSAIKIESFHHFSPKFFAIFYYKTSTSMIVACFRWGTRGNKGLPRGIFDSRENMLCTILWRRNERDELAKRF